MLRKKKPEALKSARVPNPPPTRGWTSLRAHFAGRRDARTSQKPGHDNHFAFTQRLEALTHLGHAETSRWLHANMDRTDREITHHAEVIADTRRAIIRIKGRIDAIEAELLDATDAQFEVCLRREVTNLRAQLDLEQARSSAAIDRLSQLLVERAHLLDQGRSLIAAWDGRFDRLVANHHRGYLRRFKGSVDNLERPVATHQFVWINEDMPLLTSVVDPEAGTIIQLAATAVGPMP